jgi:hypothetical protein
MKPIEIEFGKLEFGTRFIDPFTGLEYIKVSDNGAEIELDGIFSTKKVDKFYEKEIVIVK